MAGARQQRQQQQQHRRHNGYNFGGQFLCVWAPPLINSIQTFVAFNYINLLLFHSFAFKSGFMPNIMKWSGNGGSSSTSSNNGTFFSPLKMPARSMSILQFCQRLEFIMASVPLLLPYLHSSFAQLIKQICLSHSASHTLMQFMPVCD